MTQGIDAVKARNGRKAPVPAPTATIVVDPNGNGDVRTIAEAIPLLPPSGGFIQLAPGNHAITSTITLPARPIVIKGVGRIPRAETMNATSLQGSKIVVSAGVTAFSAAVPDVVFEDLNIYGGSKFVLVPGSNEGRIGFNRVKLVDTVQVIDASGLAPTTYVEATESLFAPAVGNGYFLNGGINTGGVRLWLNQTEIIHGNITGYPSFRAVNCTLAAIDFFLVGDYSKFVNCWLNSGVGVLTVGPIGGGVGLSVFTSCQFASAVSVRAPDCSFLNCLGGTFLAFQVTATGTLIVGTLGGELAATDTAGWKDLRNERAVSASTPLDYTYETVLVDASGGSRTITVTPTRGRRHIIKKVDNTANAVVITPATGTIDGAASITLDFQWAFAALVSDGTNWYVVAQVGVTVVPFLSTAITTVAINTLLDATHGTVLVDATGGARTITLPAVATCRGRIYEIVKIDSSVNLVILDPNGAETIDGNLTLDLSCLYDSVQIQSNGVSWSTLNYRTSIAHEPMGFPVSDDTYTTFAWDNATKILTVTPVGAAFDVWVKGHVFRKMAPVSKDISATVAEGLWYFWFDAAGTLQGSQAAIDFSTQALVAIGYYDATAANMIMLCDERHGLVMDWSTHQYLHDTRGMAVDTGGFGLSGSIVGSGGADVDAEVGMTGGEAHDEDLLVNVTDGALGVRFRQPLALPSSIPVYYRTGAATAWRKKTANAFPVLEDGANRIKYNLNTAGTWTQPNVTANGRHMAMWICATNNYREPIIAILGQREDTNLNNAQTNNTFASLNLAGLPSLELKVLWRLIYQTADTYANTPHARLRDITDYRTVISLPGGGAVTTSHNAMTGRDIYAAHPRPAVAMLAATVTTTPIALSSSYDVVLVDTTVGHITLNLPPAAAYIDRSFTVKKISADAFTVILDADGAETIDGAGTLTLTAIYDAVRVVSNGLNWYVVMSKVTVAAPGATLSSATGTSANAYASILSVAKAGGILGHGTVKNTLAVNTITIRRSVTDAFGTVQTTEDNILPSASLSYSIFEPVGTAVPPYVAFDVEVKSTVGGAHSDYNLKNSSI